MADSTPSVVAIVGIGNWRAELDATRLAVLDIVGGRDVKAMANAERRRHQYRTGGMHAYRGIIIPGADRTFRGFEYDVAKTVHGWVAQGPASPRTKGPADM